MKKVAAMVVLTYAVLIAAFIRWPATFFAYLAALCLVGVLFTFSEGFQWGPEDRRESGVVAVLTVGLLSAAVWFARAALIRCGV